MVDLEDKRNCMTTWILNISMYLLCLWFAFFWLICVSLTEMWFIDNFGDLISESLTLHFQKFPVHGIFNCMLLKRRQPWQTLDNNYNPIIHRYSVHQQVRDDRMATNIPNRNIFTRRSKVSVTSPDCYTQKVTQYDISGMSAFSP